MKILVATVFSLDANGHVTLLVRVGRSDNFIIQVALHRGLTTRAYARSISYVMDVRSSAIIHRVPSSSEMEQNENR